MVYEKKELRFRNLEYSLKNVTYYYHDVEPYAFFVSATVKVPEELYQHEMILGFPLETGLPFVEKEDIGMVKYIRNVIAGFSGKPEPELLAFQSLEEEGFDLELFMRHILSGINIEMEETEITEEDEPTEKEMSFSKIKYKIIEISYGYGEEDDPPVFYINMELKVPKVYFKEHLNIGFTLDQVFHFVERDEPGMIQYIKTAISNFQDEKDAELLAFQSLEDDGFDFTVLIDALLKGMTLTAKEKNK